MKHYGLIGKSLTHSFSKEYFTTKFLKEGIEASYELFEFESISNIAIWLKSTNLNGANITIPFKESIIPFLDCIYMNTQKIGAVNVIKKENNIWIGTNTDVIGFEKSFTPLLKNQTHAMILGTGGASKAVQFVLKKLNIPFVLVSSSLQIGTISYADIDEAIIKKYSIIINCTPLGTFPNVTTCPAIPYNLLNANNYLFDMVYNPEPSLFLQKGLQQGATIKSGLEMLHLQAEAGWQFFNEKL